MWLRGINGELINVQPHQIGMAEKERKRILAGDFRTGGWQIYAYTRCAGSVMKPEAYTVRVILSEHDDQSEANNAWVALTRKLNEDVYIEHPCQRDVQVRNALVLETDPEKRPEEKC